MLTIISFGITTTVVIDIPPFKESPTVDFLESLAIPEIRDSIARLNDKMVALGNIIDVRRSIAIATEFVAVAIQSRDAINNGVKQMTPNELDWWQAYIENWFQLPKIDWSGKGAWRGASRYAGIDLHGLRGIDGGGGAIGE